MTIRERIEAAYRCQPADRVPWTCYGGLLPRGAAERRLRNQGLGLVGTVRTFRSWQPHVEVRTETVPTADGPATRTTYVTPVGQVYEMALSEPGYGSQWKKRHLIQSPEDYPVVEFMIRDTLYEPAPAAFERACREMGDDGVVYVPVDRSPLQKLWVELMGAERFGIDLLTEPQRFWSLADLLADKLREQYRLVAQGPGQWVWFPENLTAPLIGLDRFCQHLLPWYNEQADLFHAHGKRVVAHFDGMLRVLAGAIGRTRIDVIEAFTPDPDGDLSVAAARQAWPGKCLSLNFPSSVHLRRPEEIRAVTQRLLDEAGDGIGLVVGVTENIPVECLEPSLTAIGEVLERRGRLPLNRS